MVFEEKAKRERKMLYNFMVQKGHKEGDASFTSHQVYVAMIHGYEAGRKETVHRMLRAEIRRMHVAHLTFIGSFKFKAKYFIFGIGFGILLLTAILAEYNIARML